MKTTLSLMCVAAMATSCGQRHHDGVFFRVQNGDASGVTCLLGIERNTRSTYFVETQVWYTASIAVDGVETTFRLTDNSDSEKGFTASVR